MLRTHGHADHVAHEAELGLPVVTGASSSGGLRVEAIPTPGHADDMVCFVVSDGSGEELAFSGDTLFRDSVGGGDFAAIQARRDGHLHGDAARPPPASRPHRRPRRSAANGTRTPSSRVWRGTRPEGSERVTVRGEPATLVVWSPDYDGNGKAWVRFDDGPDAIVGGSAVSR